MIDSYISSLVLLEIGSAPVKIGFEFLFKINRKNPSNCDFCDRLPESIIQFFIYSFIYFLCV